MTAYVPGFKYDIFISYAHLNNVDPKGTNWGWVDSFHYKLEYYLALKSGRMGEIKIWYDKELDGTQLFDDVISQKIRSSALFLALASKPYYKSEYCCSELKEFYNTAEGNPELLKVENRYRIVHVLLQNIPVSGWLPEFGRTPAFTFHDACKNAADWAGYPLQPGKQAYESEIKNLVDAIYDTIVEFKEAGGRTFKQSQPVIKVVEPTTVVDETHEGEFELFFADVTDTLQKLRRRVVKLIKEGDQKVKIGKFLPPPYDHAGHNDKVLERLKRARISVHLFNEIPGRAIDDEDSQTYPQKQAEIARDKAQSQLVVWVPQDKSFDQIDHDYADYKNFLENLHRLGSEQKSRVPADAVQTTHDFIKGKGEPADLAERILQKIDTLRQHDESTFADVGGILVDTHSKDARYATQIGGFLSKRGMRVHVVPHSDEGENAKMLYEETLKQVSSVLIVFGGVAESWVVGRFWAAMKAFVTKKSFIENIFIFLAPPRKSVSTDVFTINEELVPPPGFIHHMDSDRLDPEKLKLLL